MSRNEVDDAVFRFLVSPGYDHPLNCPVCAPHVSFGRRSTVITSGSARPRPPSKRGP